MFSVLESELSRSLFQATRGKIRPLSPCLLRRSKGQGSRPCSSYGDRRSPGDDVLGKAEKGRGILTSVHAGDLHPAQLIFARGYASRAPASHGSSGRPGTPQVPLDTSSDIAAFMQARPFEEIPGPTTIPQSIPFAGTRLLYYPFTNFPVANMGDMLNKLQSSYGPIMRVKFGNDWVVIIENLADIERVVRAAEEEYKVQEVVKQESPGLFSKMFNNKKASEDPRLSWMGSNPAGRQPGLTKEASDGIPTWSQGNPQTQKMRSQIAHHLNNTLEVGSYLGKQEEIACELVQCLEPLQNDSKDMQTLFYRYSIESVSHMCFNYRLGLLSEPIPSDETNKRLVESYRTVVKCLGETMTGTRVLHLLFEDPFAKRFKESNEVVLDWERCMMEGEDCGACPDNAQETSAKSMAPESCSLLQSLQANKNLTDDDISNAMHALMTIGSDSVASTLQMLLFSLATNMDKQEKLYAEIQNVLGTVSCPLNCNALDTMQYLKATVKESLRVHFPMVAGGRVSLSKNIVLQDYFVPATTPIVVNSRRTAKNPLFFDHPHYFKPERWLGEEAKKIPRLSFMPFGFGANHCPSRAFSLLEVNVAIVKILQKYKVNLPADYSHKPLDTTFALFQAPKEPLPFFFTQRCGPSKAPAPQLQTEQ